MKTKALRKNGTVLLAVVLFGMALLLACPAAAHAMDGSGKSSDPYIIMTADDLMQVAADVNGGNEEKYYYKLGSDIDLAGKNWTAIGTGTWNFYGTFDGDGHKIMNLKGSEGLFGSNRGTITNLTLENAQVTSDSIISVGLVAAVNGYNMQRTYGQPATIYKVTVSGSLTLTGAGTEYTGAGAIAGTNHGLLDTCINEATVKSTGGKVNVGGIAGYSKDDSNVVCDIIKNCGNIGDVSSNGGNTGGVCGLLDSDSNTNAKQIRNSYNLGDIAGNSNAGGIAGTCGVWCAVEGCYNAGTITASGSDSNAGSIVGDCSGSIYRCFHISDTSMDYVGKGSRVDECMSFDLTGKYGLKAALERWRNSNRSYNAWYYSEIGYEFPDQTPAVDVIFEAKPSASSTEVHGKLINSSSEKADRIDLYVRSGMKLADIAPGTSPEEGYGFTGWLDESGNKPAEVLTTDKSTYHFYAQWAVHKHDKEYLEKTETIPATCEKDGTEAYWTCPVCGKIFSDNNGEPGTEITAPANIPAIGHQYELSRWEWNGTKSADAVFTCKNDPSHIVRITDQHIYIAEKAASHDAYGTRTNTAAIDFEGHTYTDTKVQLLPKTPHVWGEAEYTWSNENTRVIAKRTCTRNASHVEVTVAEAAAEVTKAPTCTEMGETTYTAKFENPDLKTQTKTVEDVPAAGHTWGQWQEVTPATETAEGLEKRVCESDPTHVEERVIPKEGHKHVLKHYEGIPATCTEAGCQEYWKCEEGDNPCGRIFSDAKGKTELDDPVIPALGHDFEVKWSWSSDNSSATALFVCKNKCGTEEAVHATVTANRTEPSCDSEGSEICTATAEFKGETYTDVKRASLPALGHNFGPWERYDAEKHQRVCGNDPSHIEQADHTWDAGTVTKEATATEDGLLTYTCTACGAIRTEVIPAGTEPEKLDNPMEVKGNTVKIKGKKKVKKTKTVKAEKAYTITDAQGTLSFAKVNKAGKKKIKVNKNTGAIKVKKGLKKGTYKVKIKVTAAGTDRYNPASIITKVKIRVK